jgi:hypothetical protein
VLIVVTSCSRYGYLAFVSVVVERRKNNKISLSCVLFGAEQPISAVAPVETQITGNCRELSPSVLL